MKLRRLWRIVLVGGLLLFAGGAGMRVYAAVTLRLTEQHLISSRPASPSSLIASLPRANEGSEVGNLPAEAAPSRIELPDFGLWNNLEAVDETAAKTLSNSGTVGLDWDVSDAGWHIQSGWPGWGRNIVVAGHSPSLDPHTWPHSIFRQLAYLTPGNRIEVTAGSRIYGYVVAAVFAIPAREAATPEAAAWIASGSGEHLTLVTCWPPNTAAYRIVVVAVPEK